MHKPVSSKHLESVSDLTLTAPIREGFVDAFESVTYESRLRMVLKGLFKLRATAREHSTRQPFVDTSARIHSLLDYRIAILDTQPKRLLLAATFDRPLEPYMRLIWNPLGPLLDLIFCNCEGYVTATEHGFPDYLQWVRSSQVDSNFFYSANGNSIDDMQYALQIERLEREAKTRINPAAVTVEDPEALAKHLRDDPATKLDSDRIGVEALVALYRLTDVYPPDHREGDGRYLLWAAQHLLKGWNVDALAPVHKLAVAEQLQWLAQPGAPDLTQAHQPRLTYAPKDIQGGIVHNYGRGRHAVRHGALLLMRFGDPAEARRFVGTLPVCSEADSDASVDSEGTFVNLAFTRHGLANIGVAAEELARFPQEFREGMEERAGLLGDLREHHPRRWTLPQRNWPSGVPAAGAPAVELNEVDLVVQVRTTHRHDGEYRVGDTTHPLHADIARIADLGAAHGVRLLSVEPMSRTSLGTGNEHFGFADGISQPHFATGPEQDAEALPLGDLLWGYANSRTDDAPAASPILDNGTFLVVRKLRQDVAALRKFVAEEVRAGRASSEWELLGKMMGRYPDGTPLVAPDAGARANHFDYSHDPKGERCPFQAHIRRTNPRLKAQDASNLPTPRILRRGMSYGPLYDDDPAAERGIMFMCYNANLSEQYETIQRWINGGNSSGVASWQNDPLMGLPPAEGASVFRFVEGRHTRRVTPGSFVTLQWGAYLFVPSMAAIRHIAEMPGYVDDGARHAALEAAAAEDARPKVRELLALAQGSDEERIVAGQTWKIEVEDFAAKDPGEKDEARGLWAAIREDHGGVIRVPYGMAEDGVPPEDVVLVASKELVMHVYNDPDGVYSMSGQMERMRASFGEIFLGMDESPLYHEKADRTNAAIFAISEEEAFAVSRMLTDQWLGFVRQEMHGAFEGGVEIDLRRDFINRILAGVCNAWFGIPDGFPIPQFNEHALDRVDRTYVDAQGWGWQPIGTGPGERRPHCPGDYMAPSRYCFYPDPHPRVQAYGQAHGQGLRAAVRAHFQALRRLGKVPQARLAKAMAEMFADDDELARTLIGVMTGFLPPADGSLRWAFYDWLEEKTLWRVQDALLAQTDPSPYARAKAALWEPLARTMQKRPSPDMLWRTVLADHELGGVPVRKGERVFISIISAMSEDAANGVLDIAPIFGGKRMADRATDPFPLHACPAYKAAMGTMLGIVSGLLEAGRIEALPAPLLVKLTDPVTTPPKAQPKPAAPSPAPAAQPAPPPGCPAHAKQPA